jgi:hypothetical protein
MSADEFSSPILADVSLDEYSEDTPSDNILHNNNARVLLDTVKQQDWFKAISCDKTKIRYISEKIKTFCGLRWVEQLDDIQRYDCFISYLQYEFLKQGLRRGNSQKDFKFYSFDAIGQPGTVPLKEIKAGER